MSKFAADLEHAKEGRIYIAIGAFVWGRDKDASKAIRAAFDAGIPSYVKPAWKNVVLLWDAPEEHSISLVDGSINYKATDVPPRKIGYFTKKGIPTHNPAEAE